MAFKFVPWTPADAVVTYFDVKGKQIRANAFDLRDMVVTNANFYYVDDVLYCQDKFGYGLRHTLSNKGLENYILNFYGEFIRSNSTYTAAKQCVKLVLAREWPRYSSASKNNFLCFSNGYINLQNLPTITPQLYTDGSVIPYSTFQLNCAWPFDQNSQSFDCRVMDDFVSRIADKNPKVIARIWEMLGYLLSPINQKCFFLLQGVPNSGKSVLANLIRSYYPPDQIENLDIDQLGKRTATSQLVHKSINMSMDLPNKTLPALAVRSIKMITGQDDITVQFRNDSYRSCNVNCRFMFATNHPLTLRGRDDAFTDRIVCIPFKVSIPREQRDSGLLQNLIAERDNIFLKAMAYLRQLHMNKYVFTGTDDVLFEPDIYYVPNEEEEAMGHVIEFIEDECDFVENWGTYSADLFYAYGIFCKKKNYTPINTPGSFISKFKKACGPQVADHRWRVGDSNLRGLRGVRLKNAVTYPEKTPE